MWVQYRETDILVVPFTYKIDPEKRESAPVPQGCNFPHCFAGE